MLSVECTHGWIYKVSVTLKTTTEILFMGQSTFKKMQPKLFIVFVVHEITVLVELTTNCMAD